MHINTFKFEVIILYNVHAIGFDKCFCSIWKQCKMLGSPNKSTPNKKPLEEEVKNSFYNR